MLLLLFRLLQFADALRTVRLPIFVSALPEGLSIASYIIVVSQLGNVVSALLVYHLSRKSRLSLHEKNEFASRTIVLTLLAAVVASFALTLTWRFTLGSISVPLVKPYTLKQSAFMVKFSYKLKYDNSWAALCWLALLVVRVS